MRRASRGQSLDPVMRAAEPLTDTRDRYVLKLKITSFSYGPLSPHASVFAPELARDEETLRRCNRHMGFTRPTLHFLTRTGIYRFHPDAVVGIGLMMLKRTVTASLVA